ncbi:nucleotide exchange factor GrpE [bacterium]|nr:nucleotide exchange factor GrpE [FCB group bacterium]MBL7192258.1 nucleotide exchange factor GrpE [bacterium]
MIKSEIPITQNSAKESVEEESLSVNADANQKTEEPAPEQSGIKKRTSSAQKLKDEISQLKEQLNEQRNEYLRLLAEFDNFRKRRMAEMIELSMNAEKSFMFDLLPVLDDFERLLNDKDSEENNIRRGAEMILNKFRKILTGRGMKPMDSIHKDFDPELHDALMTVEKDDVPPGMVVDVFEKGYLFKDNILRHAKVIVSKAPEESEESLANDRNSEEIEGK